MSLVAKRKARGGIDLGGRRGGSRDLVLHRKRFKKAFRHTGGCILSFMSVMSLKRTEKRFTSEVTAVWQLRSFLK